MSLLNSADAQSDLSVHCQNIPKTLFRRVHYVGYTMWYPKYSDRKV